MDKELKEALELHAKSISEKQAELNTATEKKMDDKVVALKSELEKLIASQAEMQKAFDEQNIEMQKMQKGGNQETKSFISDLKAKLMEEAQKLSGLKSKEIESLRLEVKSFLETANASVTTGSLIPTPQFEVGVNKAPDRMPFLLEIISSGVSNSLTIYYTQRKTRTDNTAFVAEGVAPSESVLGYETVSATMQNIAGFIKVSNNAIDDVDFILSEIQTELMTLIALKLDAAIFNGTVAANGFDGIYTAATAFSAGGATLATGVTPNKYDALVFALTQVKKANFNPNYVVLNPSDVRDMKLTRDGNGAYILPPFTTANGLAVDGVRVIENNGVTAGAYLVGDFSKAKFWTRKNVEIRIWEQNATDAQDQLKTITGYLRGTLVVKAADKLAFVKDTFADSITEITHA